MNDQEVRDKFEWGWTSYRWLKWARAKDGRKLYGANFRTITRVATLGWSTLYIQFWAKHPIAALRTIANSGQDPIRFSGQVVN